jgi:ABC-type glycerol-3-phosphate transport system substrate-binding protein
MNRLATRELAYDSPEVIETFRVIEEMVSRGFLGQDILSNDYNTERAAFEAGQVAMRWDGTWYVSEIFDTPAYDFTGVAPFPWINEEHSNAIQGGMSDGFFISSLNATDEQIEASVEFLEFLTSRENFARFNEAATVLFPADFDATPDTPDNPTFDQVIEIAATMRYMRPDLQNPDVETHMLDTVRNALQGLAMGNSAEETAEQIVAMQQIRE